MTKVVGVLCTVVLLSVLASRKANARNVGIYAARAADSVNYLGVSYGNGSRDRGLPVATVFLATGGVDAQPSYKTGLTQGVGSFPEPIGLVFFGVGLLGIALLVRRRPVEKAVKTRERVRASNPPLPVERS